MKKHMKRIVAIIASLAMIATGITFAPATVPATTNWVTGTHTQGLPKFTPVDKYQLGTVTDNDADGKWYLITGQNEWANYAYEYKNADDYEGFTFNSKVYNNCGGAFLFTDDLTNEYNLQAGKTYNVSVTVAFTNVAASQPAYLTSEGATINLDNIEKTVSAGTSTQTFEGQIIPASNGTFNLKFCWSQNWQTSQVGQFEFTDITIEAADNFTPLVNAVETTPTNTPWTLCATTNEQAGMWGMMSYEISGTPASASESTSIRIDRGSGWNEAYGAWAKLKTYCTQSGLVDGHSYEGKITVTSNKTTPTPVQGQSGQMEDRKLGVKLPCVEGFTEYEIVQGENEITIPEFTFDSPNQEMMFQLDELVAGTVLNIKVEFTQTDVGWEVVPSNEKFTPTGTPWTIESSNDKSTMWGKMQYKVDGTASDYSSTYLKVVTTSDGDKDIDDPAQWWWWNKASLEGYLETVLEYGKTYTGSITVNYTAPGSNKSKGATVPSLRTIVSAASTDPFVTALSEGENTIDLGEFDYTGEFKDIIFDLDLLEQGGYIQVSDISFEQVGTWQRVPNEDDNFFIDDWKIWAADWGGYGTVMYYDTEPLKLKLGHMGYTEWSAYIEKYNEIAYADLNNGSEYYMTFTFDADRAGKAKFCQQGYEDKYEINFVEGTNTITKRFRYDVSKNYYYDEGGNPKPNSLLLELDQGPEVGTVLSNFNISFSRTDDKGWTLINDSRDASMQTFDDINGLEVHTNSYGGGTASYKIIPEQSTDLSAANIRLDTSSGTFDNDYWALTARIPNDVIYAKNDTNGNPLVPGQDYTLKFYYDTTNTGSMTLTQQGYRMDQYGKYPVTQTGRQCIEIPFTFDVTKVVDNQYVQFEMSEFPAGTIIGNVDWEFYTPAPAQQYAITIDGTVAARVEEGDNYAFPSGFAAADIGYISVDGGDVLDPGTEVGPIHEDRNYLSVDSIEVTKQPGAAMRFMTSNPEAPEGLRGIAFGADFAVKTQKGDTLSMKTYPEVYASDSFKLGTLITTYDFFTEFYNQTLDLEMAAPIIRDNKPGCIKNVVNDGTFYDGDPDGKTIPSYRAGIVNVTDNNISREFIARSYGYVVLKSGKTSPVVYADYSDVRSIKQVATTIKSPEQSTYYNGLDKWKRDIVDYCAAFEG